MDTTRAEPSYDETRDRAMVIVETRPSYLLDLVIRNAVDMNPGWNLYVVGNSRVHGHLNRVLLGKWKRVMLDVERMSPSDYSKILLQESFWTLFGEKEEHILVFQTDCVMVRPVREEHLRFDMLGAVCGSLDPGCFIMNGGLSLRKKSAMLAAIRSMSPLQRLETPEDIAFTQVMRQSPQQFILPCIEDCNNFAIESIGNAKRCIGMHGTDKYYCSDELLNDVLDIDEEEAKNKEYE